MTNRRVRTLIAQTRGLQMAIGWTLVGILLFLVGSALSFQVVIRPLLTGLNVLSRNLFAVVVPKDQLDLATHFLGGAFLVLGLFFLILGIRQFVLHLIRTLNPALGEAKVGEVYLRRQKLAQGPRIVALGGGTGLSTLLRGLKVHTSNITAIVTVTDDGGSSGRLSQDMGMIPPGDIRNCLVALADAEKAMTDLFQHRFKKEAGSLSGHSMGNLLIAALVDQSRGDFEKAVDMASNVLAIRGRVVPSTLERVGLRAILDTGEEICGETAIVKAGGKIRRIYLEPPDVSPQQAALDAIAQADLICIGPGSVYTSVIPTLLVPGITEALRTARAPRAYICNVMTQPGESDEFAASEHVTAVQVNVEKRVFDYVVVNTAMPSSELLERYLKEGQHFVEPDIDRIRATGFRVIQGDFMSESNVVRHDPMRLAARLIALLQR
ncbi:MAG TPA: YvcK family protein [Fimbriimonadaceae bacterium]|nr:YvcK family protein [Fimbriimonadaceae bacterium]